MRIEDADVTILGSVIRGADHEDWVTNPARRAIHVQSGTLRLGPANYLSGGMEPGPFPNTRVATVALSSTSPVRPQVDPRALSGAGWGVPIDTRYLHSVTHGHVTQNEPYTATVLGPPGGFALLAIGTSVAPGVPSPLGLLGIDTNDLVVIGLGALGATTGHLDVRGSVWHNAPVNHLFAFQAAVLDPAGAITLTLPTPFTVGWRAGRTLP